MARINLLPWRAALKKQRQIEFFVTIGAVAVLALLVWLLAHFIVADHIAHQNERNSYLQAETAKLDSQIKEIQELEKEKQRLEILSIQQVCRDRARLPNRKHRSERYSVAHTAFRETPTAALLCFRRSSSGSASRPKSARPSCRFGDGRIIAPCVAAHAA